jgi:hypothetical protein
MASRWDDRRKFRARSSPDFRTLGVLRRRQASTINLRPREKSSRRRLVDLAAAPE